MKVTVERLRYLLSYDQQTGIFTWNVMVRGRFAREGALAGSPSSNGYIRICIDRVSRGAHQWAWYYVTGEWPTTDVDHRDGCKTNNAFSNLRLATVSQNRANSRPRRTLKGVTKHRQRWCAQITVNKKRIYLGCFKSPEEAHQAYCVAAINHHGEFARLK